jgi:hypothetical protein
LGRSRSGAGSLGGARSERPAQLRDALFARCRQDRRAASEHDRAPAVDDHAIVEMQRHGPREDQALDIATNALEVVGALAMVDADDVLVDDRSVVELLGQ